MKTIRRRMIPIWYFPADMIFQMYMALILFKSSVIKCQVAE